jgi:arylsulfatase A-like enzyme
MLCKKRAIGITIILVAAVLACFWRTSPSNAAAKPNIIFILTDDQRLEDIKHMPILQRLLVRDGISFQNYFCNVSLCCPSRTAILRGQFAHNTGVMTNGGDNGGFGAAHSLGVENSTIAVWLHDDGYKTALIGKYLNGYPEGLGAKYIPPGWDYWASAVRGRPYSEYNYTLNENGNLASYGNSPDDYGTDVYTHHAVRFIKDCQTAHKPFFLYLAFYAPHAPATPAPRHMDLFRQAQIQRTKAFNEENMSSKPQYLQELPPMRDQQIESADAYYGKRLRSLQAVDEAIQTICQTLTDLHQLDNTYIFFATDNGYHLGEHRLLRGKTTAYETDIHLPLIVRGPGVAHSIEASELVGNIDLAPTFADLAGAKSPDFIDGRSFAAILRGETPTNWRREFLVEHWQHERPNIRGQRGQPNMRARRNPRLGASNSPIELAAYTDEEQMHDQASADIASDRPHRRQLSMPAGKLENSGKLETAVRVPQYRALRSRDRTFVEYVTGEKELYHLTEDPDELNNLVDKTSRTVIESVSGEVQRLSTSAAQAARHLESAK